MFNYVFLTVLCFMFVLYCLRLGIEFSRLMAHYKCILLLLLLLLLLYLLSSHSTAQRLVHKLNLVGCRGALVYENDQGV